MKFPVSSFITDKSDKAAIFLKVMEIQTTQENRIHLFQEIERTSLADVRKAWEAANPCSIEEGIAGILKNAPSLLSLQHIEVLNRCSDSEHDKYQTHTSLYKALTEKDHTIKGALALMTKYGNDLLNSPKYFDSSSPIEKTFNSELDLWVFLFMLEVGFLLLTLPVKAVLGVPNDPQ